MIDKTITRLEERFKALGLECTIEPNKPLCDTFTVALTIWLRNEEYGQTFEYAFRASQLSDNFDALTDNAARQLSYAFEKAYSFEMDLRAYRALSDKAKNLFGSVCRQLTLDCESWEKPLAGELIKTELIIGGNIGYGYTIGATGRAMHVYEHIHGGKKP